MIKQKEKKGYLEVSDSKEKLAEKKKDSKPIKKELNKVDEDGIKWVEAEGGYFLGLEDGKLVAKNPKGKRLKSVAKKQKETETGAMLLATRDWLKEHETECLETVESWMLRSLPIPTVALIEVWPDKYWRKLLENTIVQPFENENDEKIGLLRAVDKNKGLGLVNLDGDTVWVNPEQTHIPHPILLEDLEDWRELATDLEVVQGLQQLMRQAFEKPEKVEGKSIEKFNDAVFEPLGSAMRKTWALGCRVRGGYATTTVWEEGKRIEAGYWIGAEDPAYEGYGGELVWTDDEQNTLELTRVGPVAWSEGMRMAEAVYGVRKIEESEDT